MRAMRIARQEAPGIVHHVISRFVDRTWFLTDDVERDRYLHLLGQSLRRSDWRCLAYALMSNHLHLALIAGSEALESWTKRVHSPFANWMNRRHQRLGPIFADRPATFAMRPESEGPLIAYIHNNPVRAGVVTRARDSHWTSHRIYVGAALAPDWLHVDEGLARCGVAASMLDAWVAGDATSIESPDLKPISRVARARGALHVGTPTVSPTDVPLVARHFARIRPDPRAVLDVVSQVTGIPMTTFASRRREQNAIEARRIAIHAGKRLGLTGSEMASALGIGRQTASRMAGSDCQSGQRAMVDVIVHRLNRPAPPSGRRRDG
jgi:putative transposase